MGTFPVSRLKPGMVIANDIVTKRGQTIIDAGTPLTSTLIARLTFYRIENVEIDENAKPKTEEPESEAKPKEEVNPAPKEEKPKKPAELEKNTYVFDALGTTQKLAANAENQEAQVIYARTLSSLKENFEYILDGKYEKISDESVLKEARLLFATHSSVKLFDLLRTLKGNDDTVYAHSVNVAMIARVLGKWLKMSSEDLDTLTIAGLLHDIGKTQIPSDILAKTGKLTDEEFAKIKEHPLNGFKILKKIPNIDNRILMAALQHHERFDGSGYPRHLTGDEIDDFAAIMAIADVYDAMTATRSYRSAKCAFEVIHDFEKDGFQKYNTKFIMTFLEHIASYYNNSRVMLSNEQSARIIYINRQSLSRPIVKLNNGDILDLSRDRELHIVSTM